MDTQTRHALKQDRFVGATVSGLGWLQVHRTNVIKVAVAIVVVAALIVTGVIVYNSRSASARSAFGQAMDIYSTPLRQPGQAVRQRPGTSSLRIRKLPLFSFQFGTSQPLSDKPWHKERVDTSSRLTPAMNWRARSKSFLMAAAMCLLLREAC